MATVNTHPLLETFDRISDGALSRFAWMPPFAAAGAGTVVEEYGDTTENGILSEGSPGGADIVATTTPLAGAPARALALTAASTGFLQYDTLGAWGSQLDAGALTMSVFRTTATVKEVTFNANDGSPNMTYSVRLNANLANTNVPGRVRIFIRHTDTTIFRAATTTAIKFYDDQIHSLITLWNGTNAVNIIIDGVDIPVEDDGTTLAASSNFTRAAWWGAAGSGGAPSTDYFDGEMYFNGIAAGKVWTLADAYELAAAVAPVGGWRNRAWREHCPR